jgi:hypothetical protein
MGLQGLREPAVWLGEQFHHFLLTQTMDTTE